MKVISSICLKPILPVAARTSFALTNARKHVGCVEIEFSMQNTSGIEAMRPFICFPEAVLPFTPCAGWTADAFLSASGRRMIRLVPLLDKPLAAGETARPCGVSLPFARNLGGSLTLSKGVVKRLSELPDLRLFVITGAGNFASERSSITVQADEIRAAIQLGLPDFVFALGTSGTGHSPTLTG